MTDKPELDDHQRAVRDYWLHEPADAVSRMWQNGYDGEPLPKPAPVDWVAFISAVLVTAVVLAIFIL